ncbi:MAG: sigma-70 family RNA polymerase sigma factor [Planctomycetes bacterium]|nr:sigma-70 family RNA polymerase sigma factor [Planctomycetota bacterium]
MDHTPTTPEDLLNYDRFIRSIARRLMIEGDAADDVVQQTYMAALEKSPAAPDRIRSWIGSIARNFALEFHRKESLRIRHERAAARPESLPSAADIAAIEETRHRLGREIIELPERYRIALWLRFYENQPPRMIAKRLGIPVETAKTLIKRGIELLRQRLDERYASRRDCFAALIPLAAAAPGWWASGGAAGALKTLILMTTKTKAIAAAIIIFTLSLVIWSYWGGANDAKFSQTNNLQKSGVPLTANASAPAAAESLPAPAPRQNVSNPTAESLPASKPAPADTGTLILHFLWGDDKTPATGIQTQVLAAFNQQHQFSPAPLTADASGSIRVDNIRSGHAWIRVDRWFGESLMVKPGVITEKTFNIPKGFNVDGVVVNASGRPVAGADIILNEQGTREINITKTDADGKFMIRSVSGTMYFISARADRYAPSKEEQIMSREGGNLTFKFVLPGPGGGVAGRAIDPNGKPVARARVACGPAALDTNGKFRQRHGLDPDFARVFMDTTPEGIYQFEGLKPGPNRIIARIDGFAPFQSIVDVPTTGIANLDILFQPGVAVAGVVTDSEGKPAKAVGFTFGGWGDFDRYETRSGADGHYILRDLPPGEIKINADHDTLGSANITLTGAPGAELTWDAMLSLGLSISGRVVDENASPLKEALVEIFAMEKTKSDHSGGMFWTDAEGKFKIAKLENVEHQVRVRGPEGSHGSLVLNKIKPGGPALQITLTEGAADCAIIGTLLGPNDQPVAGAQISAWRVGEQTSPIDFADPKTGTFKLSPYIPGQYRLTFFAKGFPSTTLPLHRVKHGETWDVGIVKLQNGGRIRVAFSQEAGAGAPEFTLVDSNGWYTRPALEVVRDPAGDYAHSTESIAPGSYYINMHGKGVSVLSTPVVVSSDAETAVSIVAKAGAERTVKLKMRKPAEDASNQSPLSFEIRSKSGELILKTQAWPDANAGAYVAMFTLARGEYQFDASGDAGKASGTFTMADSDNPPLESPLQ